MSIHYYHLNCFGCQRMIVVPCIEFSISKDHYCHRCDPETDPKTDAPAPITPSKHPEATATEEPTFGILQACFDEQLTKLLEENEKLASQLEIIRISYEKIMYEACDGMNHRHCSCVPAYKLEIARLRDAITTISEINERPTNDRYIEISNACTRALGETL